MSGNSAFNGTIYAPEADISFSGGGNNTVDFMGAIVGKSVRISGKYQFHYDESLGAGSNGSDYYYATSWREVSPWQEAGP